MNHTPQPFTLTIAAGARMDLYEYGRMLTFIDITTGHSLQWAIGDEPIIAALEGISFELPALEHFGLIRLYNAGLASVTVKLILSEGRVYDNRVSLSKTLESIDDRLAGESAGTVLADTSLAVTGSAGTLLFAANSSRKKVVIQACEGNGTYSYFGMTDAVTSVAKMAYLPAMGSVVIDYYQGAIYAVGASGTQRVCGYEV